MTQAEAKAAYDATYAVLRQHCENPANGMRILSTMLVRMFRYNGASWTDLRDELSDEWAHQIDAQGKEKR